MNYILIILCNCMNYVFEILITFTVFKIVDAHLRNT